MCGAGRTPGFQGCLFAVYVTSAGIVLFMAACTNCAQRLPKPAFQGCLRTLCGAGRNIDLQGCVHTIPGFQGCLHTMCATPAKILFFRGACIQYVWRCPKSRFSGFPANSVCDPARNPAFQGCLHTLCAALADILIFRVACIQYVLRWPKSRLAALTAHSVCGPGRNSAFQGCLRTLCAAPAETCLSGLRAYNVCVALAEILPFRAACLPALRAYQNTRPQVMEIHSKRLHLRLKCYVGARWRALVHFWGCVFNLVNTCQNSPKEKLITDGGALGNFSSHPRDGAQKQKNRSALLRLALSGLASSVVQRAAVHHHRHHTAPRNSCAQCKHCCPWGTRSAHVVF